MINSESTPDNYKNEVDDINLLLTLDITTTAKNESDILSSDSLERFNLILKLRRLCGIDTNLTFTLRDTLEDLLESNGFYYRIASLNKDVKSYQQVPVISYDKNGDLSIIYSSKLKTWLYSPQSNRSKDISNEISNYNAPVYEIYPIFPEDLISFWGLLKFSFPSIKADFIKALCLSVLVTLLSLLSPIITSRVVGNVVPSGNLGWIFSTFIISILIALYSGLINWLQSFYLLRFSQKLNIRIQIPLYHRILSYPVPFLEKYTVGDLSSRATSVNNILSALSASALSSLIGVISLVGFAGLMMFYDFKLSVIVIVFVMIIAVIQTVLFRRQLFFEKQLVERKADFYEETLQSISNIAQIRTTGAEPSILKRWSRIIFSFSSLSFNVNIFSGYNQIISKFLNNVGLSLLYSVLIYRLLNSKDISEVALTTSTFIVFQSAFSKFSSKFIELIQLFNTVLGQSVVDFQRAMPLIQQKQEEGLSTLKSRIKLKGLIEFKDVTFFYPNSDKPVLNNCSFKLYPGKFNVLFGPSGCGKSTIFSLILGFYKISSGSIFIDGKEIKDIDIKNLRSQMGTVLQNPILPISSIKDALTSGLAQLDEDVWQTLKLVNLFDEIQALPMKLETILSEGAANISGGQRQRLSIARALLRRPSVLLEDESTSALDNYSQEVIVNNLRNIGLTRIVIAHRITAIKDCDHMVVITNGSVESSGSFQYCLNNSTFLSKAYKS